MSWSRFGHSYTPRPATVGRVYVEVSGDAWARARLAVVYRKLFEENGGARQGPDHYLYVKPSRARCEIRELATWLGERFGSPGGRPPRTTPFGYLGPWDGWIALFAALAGGRDDDLRRSFPVIASLSWRAVVQADGSGVRSREVRLLPGVIKTEEHAPEPVSPRPTSSRSREILTDLEKARRDLDEEILRERERREEAVLVDEEDLDEEEQRRDAARDRELERLRFMVEARKRELEDAKREEEHEKRYGSSSLKGTSSGRFGRLERSEIKANVEEEKSAPLRENPVKEERISRSASALL